MDQESAAASGASLISLTEHEQRYYSGLRALCQADAPGKLSSSKVAELFKASQLPPESLHKVSDHVWRGESGCGCIGLCYMMTGYALGVSVGFIGDETIEEPSL